MSRPTLPGRDDIVAILAELTDQPVAEVGERISSLDLARLLYEVETRHGLVLDLDDDEMSRMATVTGAAEVIHRTGTSTADG
jgi:hypothetical protein